MRDCNFEDIMLICKETVTERLEKLPHVLLFEFAFYQKSKDLSKVIFSVNKCLIDCLAF